MGCKAYIGIDNTSRNIKKCYVGVDGVARKIKKAYIGVNGIARLCYISEITNSILPCNSTTATGSILHAMGIFHGTANTDWDSLVTAVLGHLGSLGYVTADGKIKLSVLGAGVTMIPGAVIGAVRDFLFGNSSLMLSNGKGDYYDWFFSQLSVSSQNIISSGSFQCHCMSATYVSSITGNLITKWIYFWVSGVGSLARSGSTITASYTNSKWFVLYSETAGSGYATGTGYLQKQQTGVYSISIGDDSTVFTPSAGVSSSLDLNTGNVGTLNPDDNIDVIYPGWASHSENVDTNIDVVADAGTGAIDGVITADKYYPIGIPDLGTSIYDQTQAGAQTGTNAVLLI